MCVEFGLIDKHELNLLHGRRQLGLVEISLAVHSVKSEEEN